MKLTADMTPEEIRREVVKLRRSLGQKASIVMKDKEASKYVARMYYDTVRGVKTTSRLKDDEVLTLYRDLSYINSLKGIDIKEARDVPEKVDRLLKKLQMGGEYETIRGVFDDVSKTQRDKLYDIYSKFIGLVGGSISELYKYEIWDTAIDYLYRGEVDTEKIAGELEELYNKSRRELGGKATDDKVFRLFTSKLDSLFK